MFSSHSQDVWIGLYREPGVQEDWTWVDGTILNLFDPVHYQDWADGDPNESYNDALGVRIVLSVASFNNLYGKWGDRPQAQAYWAVCEKGKGFNLIVVTVDLFYFRQFV